ncbi:hypothetical protein ACVWZK_005134 [Bradyrhizobium sp. GM0.4]
MTDAFKGDKWITENSQISAEKLHALGVVNYRWNCADVALKSLLAGVARFEFIRLWTIIHDLGDLTASAAILEILYSTPQPEPVDKAIRLGLKLYEQNRVNRNQLTHFGPGMRIDADLTRMKGPRFNPQALPDSIADIRRVADDMGRLLDYFSKLITVVYARQYSLKSGGILPPLPEPIALPELLVKPRPQESPTQRGEPDTAQPGREESTRAPSRPRLTEEEWLAKYRTEGRPLPDGAGAE